MIPHPNLRPVVVALVFGALATPLLMPAGASAGACQHAHSKPGSTSVRNLEKATRCLINKRRTRRGLRKLDGSDKLDESSARHSRDMDERNYFSHTSRNGDSLQTRVRRTGYLRKSNDWLLGENIGWQQGGKAAPSRIVEGWMNSSSHRSLILKRSLRDVGVGVVGGAPRGGVKNAGTYTTDFGRN